MIYNTLINKTMKTQKSGNYSFKKMMLTLTFAAGLFITITGSASAQDTYNGEEVFVVAEEMPVFPGDSKALYQAIGSNLKYPVAAKEANIEGKVMVRFIVDKDGVVRNPVVAKSVDPSLDKAALDAIKMLPKFRPGKIGGRPVNVYYTVPIAFQLN